MNLKNLETYLDNISPSLKEVYKTALSSMFYDAYLQGIQEGKNQVKNKLIENLLLLMDAE